MCDLLSGWINVNTEEVECLSLTSHSETQARAGWNSKGIADWREWEWKQGGVGVRLHKGDEHDEAWYQSALIARFKDRMGALNWCAGRVAAAGHALDLSGLTSAAGLTLPSTVGGYLYLRGLTSAAGLTLPSTVSGGLDLSGLTSADRYAVIDKWKSVKV